MWKLALGTATLAVAVSSPTATVGRRAAVTKAAPAAKTGVPASAAPHTLRPTITTTPDAAESADATSNRVLMLSGVVVLGYALRRNRIRPALV